MKLKKDGQALVEFIIILPILIIILLGVMDFSFIFYKKNVLENKLDDVVDMWKNEKNILEIESYLKNDELEFNYIIEDDSRLLIFLF